MSDSSSNTVVPAVASRVTCIDVFDNNVVSIMRGVCETGRLRNANDCAISDDIANNDLINLFLNEIRAVDLDPNVRAANRLQRARAQVRLFDVPDGPLGITVSEVSRNDGSIAAGLRVLEVENLVYFSPGDIISAINGVSMRNLRPELAVAMLTQTKNRKLIVVRTNDPSDDAISTDISVQEPDSQDVDATSTTASPSSRFSSGDRTTPRATRILSKSPRVGMYSATYLSFYTKMRHKFESPYTFLSANKLLDNGSCFMT